jgi:hypothetical protein
MTDGDLLAPAFAEHRDHLRAVACRLLGSVSDADDAVQDTRPSGPLSCCTKRSACRFDQVADVLGRSTAAGCRSCSR